MTETQDPIAPNAPKAEMYGLELINVLNDASRRIFHQAREDRIPEDEAVRESLDFEWWAFPQEVFDESQPNHVRMRQVVCVHYPVNDEVQAAFVYVNGQHFVTVANPGPIYFACLADRWMPEEKDAHEWEVM